MTPDPRALADRVVAPSTVGGSAPSWISLGPHDTSVAVARRFAEHLVSGRVRDADQVHSIVLIVSELVTNALRAAREMGRWAGDDRVVRLGILITDRCVHLRVADPDRRPIAPAAGGRANPDGGWGLGIVDRLSAARWTEHGDDGKTVHVVVPAPRPAGRRARGPAEPAEIEGAERRATPDG